MDAAAAIARNEQLMHATTVCECGGEPDWISCAPELPDSIAFTCRHCGFKGHVTREEYAWLLSVVREAE